MLLILALLLFFSVSSSAQVILPAEPVGEPSTHAIAGGGPVAVAAGDSNFLIVSAWSVHFSVSGAYAMLVDEHGKPLLRTSIWLPAITLSEAAAWSGREYLVVMGSYNGNVTGVRIDGSGTVLDPTPIEIHPAGPFTGSSFCAVVWDGTQFVVVTAAGGGPPTFVAARVSEAGKVLQNDIPLTPSGFGVSSLAAFAGTTIVLWSDAAGSHMRTMSSAGVLGEIRPWPNGHRVIAGAGGFLDVSGPPDAIQLQRLDSSGAPDGPPSTISVSGSSYILQPAGSAFLLVYTDSVGAQRFVPITSNGQFLGTAKVVGGDGAVQIAANDTTGVAVWATGGSYPYVAPTTMAKGLGTDDAPLDVHRALVLQSNPRVTWRGDQALVAWVENGLHEKAIGSTSLVREAAELPVAIASGPAVTLTVTARAESSTGPAGLYAGIDGREPVQVDANDFDDRFVRAVWTGSDFIVVWQRRSGEILGARIDSSGAVTNGPQVIGTANALTDIAAGASASQVLVVLQDNGVARGILLSRSGEVATDDITTATDFQATADSFSIASDGTNFFVTWIDRSNTGNDWVAGRIIDANGHGITPVSGYSTGTYKGIATTFWTGGTYLVVGSTRNGVETSLFEARVTSDGRLLDYPPVAIGPVTGIVTSFAAGPSGQIVFAFTNGIRAYTSFIVPSRQRAVTHR